MGSKSVNLDLIKEKIAQYFEMSIESSGIFNSGDPSFEKDYIENILKNEIGKEVYQIVKNYPKDPEKIKILDVGCGLGGFILACQDNGIKALGLEIDHYAAEIARLRLGGNESVVVSDGENLPFGNDSFDIVTSITVIEHVKDIEKSLREARRVLKRGGCLVIFAPNYLFPWEGHYKLFWLPYLLPYTKFLFKLYLKLKKRDPRFVDFVNFKITPGYLKKKLIKSGFTKIQDLSIQRFKERLENPQIITNPKPKKIMTKIRNNKLLYAVLKLFTGLLKISRLYHPIILVAEKS